MNKTGRDSVNEPGGQAETSSPLNVCVNVSMCVSADAGQISVTAASSHRGVRDEGERGAEESHRAE